MSLVWRIQCVTHCPGNVWHDSFICVTWLIHMCDITHSYVSFNMSLVWRIQCVTHCPGNVWHDSFICVTWLIHMCAMTHSYVCHDPCIRVTWLIHVRDMTQHKPLSWMSHSTRSGMCDTLMPLAVCVCDMTYSLVWHTDAAHCVCMWHDLFTCVTRWCCSLCWCVTWPIYMCDMLMPLAVCVCDMTHSSVWHDVFICVTWLMCLRDMTHITYMHESRRTVIRMRDTLMPLTVCVCDSSQIWQTDRLCGCVCVWVCVHVYMRINERVTHTHTTRVWQVCDTMTQLSLIDASVTHRDSYIWFVTQVCDYDTSVADRLCACVCVYTCMRINERVTHTHMTRTYVAHWSTCVT